ncbi:MAG: hypothetical protein ACXAD7_05260 [Candidatus Kariarchaeaceae archaeon]
MTKESQVYCSKCKETSFIQLDLELIQFEFEGTSGLLQKSLIHGDHIVVVEIDRNGTIRSENALDVMFSPIQTLLKDIAHTFLFLETDGDRPVHIDTYTSNMMLSKFFQSIISMIFERSLGKDIANRKDLKAVSKKNKTLLDGKRVQLSVGPFIQEKIDRLDNPLKGIILDIEEAERNKLEIEKTFEKYDWVALLVPSPKKEGYSHAFSSYFSAQNKPFFIDTISNQSIKELFDFIFAIIYGLN